jgi:uncharacterized membrane protein
LVSSEYYFDFTFELLILFIRDEELYRFSLLYSAVDASSMLVSWPFLKIVLINGVTYAAYNQMSFLVLSLVTMVTHAVGNSLRRVVTILASIWVFGNAITTQNAVGIFLAVGGVIAYSISKYMDESKVKKGGVA